MKYATTSFIAVFSILCVLSSSYTAAHASSASDAADQKCLKSKSRTCVLH